MGAAACSRRSSSFFQFLCGFERGRGARQDSLGRDSELSIPLRIRGTTYILCLWLYLSFLLSIFDDRLFSGFSAGIMDYCFAGPSLRARNIYSGPGADDLPPTLRIPGLQ